MLVLLAFPIEIQLRGSKRILKAHVRNILPIWHQLILMS